MSKTIDRQWTSVARTAAGSQRWVQRLLVGCGIAAPVLYVVMNIVAAIRFTGYSTVNQTVSELSAVSAPSRPLWVRLAIVYGLLLVAPSGWASGSRPEPSARCASWGHSWSPTA